MSEFSISNNPLSAKDFLKELAGQRNEAAQNISEQNSASDTSFSGMLKNQLNKVNESQVVSDQAVSQLSLGKADNLHDVMIKLEKAEIALRTAVSVRNKIVEAYQEIMRMPV